MILTTTRIVCMNKDTSSKFRAFDIPISLTTNEGFKQPIFGANYLCGDCAPLMNILPGNIHFKIWFMEGGCGTFVPAYLKMVASMRRNQNKRVDQQVINAIQSGTYKSMAYIDPNDPSVIYLEQPEIQSGNYNPFGGNGQQQNAPGYQPVPQMANQLGKNYPSQPQAQPQYHHQ